MYCMLYGDTVTSRKVLDYCNLLETVSTPRETTQIAEANSDSDDEELDDESYYSRVNKKRGIFQELSMVESGQKSINEFVDI